MFEVLETPNPFHLEVKAMKMSTDDSGHKVCPPLEKGNFYYIFSGGPRSGKSNLWLSMIKMKNAFYYKQFHKIYIFSNSIHTIKEKLSLPKEQIINGLDLERLREILSEVQEEYNEDIDNEVPPSKLLFIFDDVITSITKNLPEMLKLVFNRRHVAGGASVIITTQKYNKVPLELRTCCSGLAFFHTKNRQEIESLHKELIGLDRKPFEKVLDYIFDAPHNFLWLNLNYPHDKMMHKNFNQLEINV